MRFTKRRDHAARQQARPDGIIVFQHSSQNWRERVKALKAAQRGDPGKADAKPDRS